MPENLASFKVFCQGGLNTSRDVLSQGENQPGSAVSLINYEPAVNVCVFVVFKNGNSCPVWTIFLMELLIASLASA